VPGMRTLVAGVGNLFLSDDGFGPEVARRLSDLAVPEGVRVVDYGIRGTHLAYDLIEGWDRLILIDLVPPRGQPGRIHVLEVGPDEAGDGAFDPHGMEPRSMLHTVAALGGHIVPTIVVGCEPAELGEGIGLSPAVNEAVGRAAQMVVELLATAAGGTGPSGAAKAGEEGGTPSCASASPVA
jgi:hydrogenase maturation protease